jgi:hypothetical protein
MPPISSLLGVAAAMLLAPRVAAAVILCPIQAEPSAAELITGCGEPGPGPSPRQCTAALPAPADAFDVQCKTTDIPPGSRCQQPFPPDFCVAEVHRARSLNLLTSDAVTFLLNIGFCPVIIDSTSGPRIFTFCPAGCFAADTRILTSVSHGGKPGYKPASKITSRDTLMSMADDARLDDVTLATLPIKRIVFGPEKPQLYVFGLASGATLRVTQHHPMVLDDGTILEASRVDRNMSFVGTSGESVAITSITREPAIGDVFNFETAGDTQLSHVIVAEGVLVGDLKLQNEIAAEERSIELRR